MAIIPRPYQQEAINRSVDFFKEKRPYNGLLIEPTGSGKSVIIANTAAQIEGKTVVFQPSKEILKQNFQKFTAYGYRAGIYSASAGMKYMDDITFATIGSVTNKHHLFEKFKNIIIDEAHLVNPKTGMYKAFIDSIRHAKVLGLTATPYRLHSDMDGAMMKFITRTNPRVFNKVLHYVQNQELFDAGHLAPLEYFRFNVVDRSMLKLNSTGTDFTESSLKAYYRKINMPAETIAYANRILAKRKNILVFCGTIEDALKVSMGIPGSAVVTSDTPQGIRDRLTADFRKGVIRCMINVGIFAIGFDYPELEAVLLAASTLSLGRYYQWIGRVMRPFTYPNGEKKVGWVVDLGGNIGKFGAIETMKIVVDNKGLYSIWNGGRQLTNVEFSRFQ